MKKMLLSSLIVFLYAQAAQAEPTSRRATILGVGGNGRCSIEVTVDDAAEIEVFSDVGNLHTISGRPAYWHRFHCNAPLPHMPHDFRMARISGRGSIQLIQHPRDNRGAAVIHIRDPQSGPGRYMVELTWRGEGNWSSPSFPPGHGGAYPGGSPVSRAIQACQRSVSTRLNRDGYFYVSLERATPDDNPGRHGWIRGIVSAKRKYDTARFGFACSVDFSSGQVRSVDVQRR